MGCADPCTGMQAMLVIVSGTWLFVFSLGHPWLGIFSFGAFELRGSGGWGRWSCPSRSRWRVAVSRALWRRGVAWALAVWGLLRWASSRARLRNWRCVEWAVVQ